MDRKIKEQIIQLRSQGLGYKRIAKELDVNLNSVKSFCRTNKNKLDIINCKFCKKIINKKDKKKTTKFCSNECRMKWWNKNRDKLSKKKGIDKVCKNCHKKFRSYKQENRKYCSHQCYITDRFKEDKK